MVRVGPFEVVVMLLVVAMLLGALIAVVLLVARRPKLGRCPACGREVSTAAPACPGCGQPRPSG